MRRLIYFIFALCVFGFGSAFGAVVKDVSIEEDNNQALVLLSLSGLDGQKPKIFQLDGRVVIDLDNSHAKLKGYELGQGQNAIEGKFGIEKIRYARRNSDDLRLVIDLEEDTKFLTSEIELNAIKLIFATAKKTQAKVINAVVQTRNVSKTEDRFFSNLVPYPRLKPRGKAAPTPFVKPLIAIDAGHGGRDPGALGKSGTHEASITLKAALELQKMLLKTNRYKVILTRKSNKYVEHEERIRIARAASADLFISIHADSAGSFSARGASVYTLSGKSRNRSKKIVNTQNWIMDVDLTEQSNSVGTILVDLAERKTFSQSELFADILIKHISKTSRLVGNSHRRAGYYVLLAPDVPAVLLELGFLSNPQDEKLLKSAGHRSRLMASVVSAIDGYFKHQKS